MSGSTQIVFIIILLVGLSGLIAYVGDRLGVIIGKKRLSLFGARPKRTGQIIGVVAGLLIMLMTLGTLGLAFRGAARTIIDAQNTAQRTAERYAGVQAELRSQQRETDALAEQIESQQAELERALRESSAAEEAKQAAEDELAEAQDQLSSLRENRNTLNEEVENLNSDLEQAAAELDKASTERRAAETAREEALEAQSVAETQAKSLQDQKLKLQTDVFNFQTDLEEAREQLEAVEEQSQALQTRASELETQNADLSENNEQLAEEREDLEQRRIELEAIEKTLSEDIKLRNDDLNLVRGEVEALTQELNVKVEELGELQASLDNIGNARVVFEQGELVYTGIVKSDEKGAATAEISEIIQQANNAVFRNGAERVVLASETFDALVQDVIETPGENIVTLRSPSNQFDTKDINVSVESMANDRIVSKGQLIVSRQIHMGSDGAKPINEVRGDLTQLLADANSELLLKGLADSIYNSPDNDLKVAEFQNQLQSIKGPATIAIMAAEEIFRGSSPRLEFVILN